MSKRPTDPNDPKGLIRESYRIDGITGPECRSIFLDWALSLANEVDTTAAIKAHLGTYETARPDHPMTQTLTQGLDTTAQTGRRGGRAARVANGDPSAS